MNIAKLQQVLTIISKYVDVNRDYCEAQHDIIFFPLMNNTKISEEDNTKLLELGCHKSRDGDCWATHT